MMEPAQLESLIRRVVSEEVASVRGEVASVRDEVAGVRGEVASVRDEIAGQVRSLAGRVEVIAEESRARELKTTENARVMFGQLSDLYRGTLKKIDELDKHLGDQLAATRGSIEALRASLERQDFRADSLGRRLTALETRFEPHHEE